MLLLGPVFFIAGLIAGAAVAWVVAASRSRDAGLRAESLAAELAEKNRLLDAARDRESTQREQLAALTATAQQTGAQLTEMRAALDRARSEAEQSRREAESARVEAAQFKTALEKELSGTAEKISLVQQAEKTLSDRFERLASEILEKKSKAFTDQNQASLATLLNPLREKFGEFQQNVEGLKKDAIAGRSELKEQITSLRTLNERLSQDAANLVTALKGSSKVQGDWGELVLEKLLESAGLRRDVEYRVQQTFGREEGGNARLDVIIDLPDNRHLVIDSKVSLNSYSDYCNNEDDELRKQALKQHLASVRQHFKDLSARNYQDLYQLQSCDFVLMFVPIEPAFMLAIAQDSRIWQDAYDRNVLLVSPSSLLCVVRTVAQIWRQERQTRNVEEIAKRGRILYDKFRGFTEDLLQVGRRLGDAREAYENAYNKLSRADGNLVSQAEKLVKLGIRPTKPLPLALVEQAVEGDEALELAAAGEDSSRNGHGAAG